MWRAWTHRESQEFKLGQQHKHPLPPHRDLSVAYAFPWPPQLQASGSQAGVCSLPALSKSPATHREVSPSCLTNAEVSAPTLRGAVGERMSWGEEWWAVTTEIQLAVTEAGTSHAGVLLRESSSSGPSLVTLGGMVPCYLLRVPCWAHTSHQD